MKKNLIICIILAVVIILEALPYGAVLNFSNGGDGGCELITRKTYSYFDLTPYGYANFGPFLTSVLTLILLALSLIYLFKKNPKILLTIQIIATISVVTSLMPLMFGIDYYSYLGALITICLLATSIIAWLPFGYTKQNN